MSGNYTVGRGKIYFDRFKAGTQIKIGERYLGNTPSVKIGSTVQNLDHFDSDAGLRTKDEQIILQVDRKLTLVTDDISDENLALFFLGVYTPAVAQAAQTAQVTEYDEARKGYRYQIGATTSNPSGARNVTNVSVKDKAGVVSYAVNEDYTVDLSSGGVTLLSTFDGLAADGLEITATYAAATRNQVISADNAVFEGALRYIADNPKGTNRDIYMPYVKITPNGDYELKGDTWQQLTFDVEILKPAVGAALYVDGRAVNVP